jgi:hypothetical protein
VIGFAEIRTGSLSDDVVSETPLTPPEHQGEERKTQFRMTRGLRGFAVLAALGLVGAVGIRTTRASDHQDNPLVELNPAMDMSDFYAFPGAAADRIVLAMDTRPLLTPAATPGASFDPNILYQFKVDNTGDAKEDKVIQITFKGTGATQTFEVRGPMAPPVVGGMMNTVARPVIHATRSSPSRHHRMSDGECRNHPQHLLQVAKPVDRVVGAVDRHQAVRRAAPSLLRRYPVGRRLVDLRGSRRPRGPRERDGAQRNALRLVRESDQRRPGDVRRIAPQHPVHPRRSVEAPRLTTR